MSEHRPRPGRDVVDPDVDDPAQRDGAGRRELGTLAVIALGGVLGAEARYGLATAIPHGDSGWPWATLLTNLVGSFVIGVLMVVVERRAPHPLVRPFLGVGICGGFTTFSTFALGCPAPSRRRPAVRGARLCRRASLFGCFAATALALVLTRRTVPA